MMQCSSLCRFAAEWIDMHVAEGLTRVFTVTQQADIEAFMRYIEPAPQRLQDYWPAQHTYRPSSLPAGQHAGPQNPPFSQPHGQPGSMPQHGLGASGGPAGAPWQQLQAAHSSQPDAHGSAASNGHRRGSGPRGVPDMPASGLPAYPPQRPASLDAPPQQQQHSLSRLQALIYIFERKLAFIVSRAQVTLQNLDQNIESDVACCR